jgi:nitrogen fixation/metabolism regulation signal transduction histidine kinase
MIMISAGDFEGKDAILAARLGDLETGITIFNERLAEFRAVTNENVEAAMITAQEYGTQVFTITAAGISIGLVGSIAIAFYMGNKISSPIKQLSQAAHNTSLGKFNQKLVIKTGDEIEELSESFNRMLNSFKLMDAMSKGSMGDEEECLLNKTA